MDNNIYKRLARAEAMVNSQKDEMLEELEKQYAIACVNQNEEDAAIYARKIRNKMLAECDARMNIDRFGLVVPTGATFSAWFEFLKTIGNAVSGDWAAYRQALRDIPQQQGFPFNIEMPEKPKE